MNLGKYIGRLTSEKDQQKGIVGPRRNSGVKEGGKSLRVEEESSTILRVIEAEVTFYLFIFFITSKCSKYLHQDLHKLQIVIMSFNFKHYIQESLIIKIMKAPYKHYWFLSFYLVSRPTFVPSLWERDIFVIFGFAFFCLFDISITANGNKITLSLETQPR